MMKECYRDWPVDGTEFSRYEKEYTLNKDGILEELPAPKDCQAIVDASKETVFEKILEQLTEVPEMLNNPSEEYIRVRDFYATNLDIMLEADEIEMKFREEHPNFKGSRKEIYKEIKKNIERSYEEYEEKKKTDEKSEQKEFPPDSATSS